MFQLIVIWSDMDAKRPNKTETIFLTLAYNRFYDIFDEIFSDSFWQKDKFYRFCKIRDGFSIYSELLNYEPIKWVIDWMKKGGRPQMEGEISESLFKFIRNTLLHFPFFDNWNDVWLSKNIVNWTQEKQSIDKFLEKYKGHNSIKYRIWEEKIKKMTYLFIRFPKEYKGDDRIYLKDIVSEKDGVKFSYILMKKILSTQIEEIK